MTEIERLSVNADSSITDVSKPTAVSNVPSIDATGTNPLPNIYSLQHGQETGYRSKRTCADDLPSKKLQYSQWHELRRTEVKGTQLKAPRVRKAPSDNARDFYELVGDDNEKIHHDKHGWQRKRHRDDMESWEYAKLASFTSQELYHGYQEDNLFRILNRLKKVVYLNLQDNELLSMSSFSFPCCEYLNLNDNYLTSLSQLPKLPKIKHLTVQRNGITSLDGLSSLRSGPIEELFLAENPVAFKIGYRYSVFSTLPQLRMLDGTAKQQEDEIAPQKLQEDLKGKTCVIS